MLNYLLDALGSLVYSFYSLHVSAPATLMHRSHEPSSRMTAVAQQPGCCAYLHMRRRFLIQDVIIAIGGTFVYVLNHSVMIKSSLQDSTKQDCLSHAHDCELGQPEKNKLTGDAGSQDLVVSSMELTADSLVA
jgi:hypothetical protein